MVSLAITEVYLLISNPDNTSGLHRVFIGIGCDDGIQEQTKKLVNPLKKAFPRIAWVPEINRHLTLAFLGNLSSSQLGNLMADFDKAYKRDKSFRYSLTKLTRFPDSNGRIVALVGDPDDRLSRVYQHTMMLLQANDLESVWDDFKPHITLGRFRKTIPFSTNIDLPVDARLEVVKITLYQSVLTSSGSVYTALREARLG